MVCIEWVVWGANDDGAVRQENLDYGIYHPLEYLSDRHHPVGTKGGTITGNEIPNRYPADRLSINKGGAWKALVEDGDAELVRPKRGVELHQRLDAADGEELSDLKFLPANASDVFGLDLEDAAAVLDPRGFDLLRRDND